MRERVFITGIGVVSSIGINFAQYGACLRVGRNGTAPISAFDASAVPGGLGCEVRDFSAADHFGRRELVRMDRCTQFALVAAREAVGHAAVTRGFADPLRVGVYLGTTLGGMINGTRYYQHMADTGHFKGSTLWDYPLFAAGAHIASDSACAAPTSLTVPPVPRPTWPSARRPT